MQACFVAMFGCESLLSSVHLNAGITISTYGLLFALQPETRIDKSRLLANQDFAVERFQFNKHQCPGELRYWKKTCVHYLIKLYFLNDVL